MPVWGRPQMFLIEPSAGLWPASFFFASAASKLALLLQTKNPQRCCGFNKDIRGAEGSRTPVQTYPSKAFYMLILALIVGKRVEPDKPIASLAVWS